MYKLRDVTEKDYMFLYELNVSTMKSYVEQTWGWDDISQQEYFKNKFSPEKLKIIVVNEKDIGVLSTFNNIDGLFIDLIEILPEYQCKGVGTAVLKDIINDAKHKKCIIKLQVLKVNPAINFYERLGFVSISETNTHFIMEYSI
jgi:ribosomal protein S18 acetylase RimI-like enzyme